MTTFREILSDAHSSLSKSDISKIADATSKMIPKTRSQTPNTNNESSPRFSRRDLKSELFHEPVYPVFVVISKTAPIFAPPVLGKIRLRFNTRIKTVTGYLLLPLF